MVKFHGARPQSDERAVSPVGAVPDPQRYPSALFNLLLARYKTQSPTVDNQGRPGEAASDRARVDAVHLADRDATLHGRADHGREQRSLRSGLPHLPGRVGRPSLDDSRRQEPRHPAVSGDDSADESGGMFAGVSRAAVEPGVGLQRRRAGARGVGGRDARRCLSGVQRQPGAGRARRPAPVGGRLRENRGSVFRGDQADAGNAGHRQRPVRCAGPPPRASGPPRTPHLRVRSASASRSGCSRPPFTSSTGRRTARRAWRCCRRSGQLAAAVAVLVAGGSRRV